MYSLHAILKISEWYDGVVNEEPSQKYVPLHASCILAFPVPACEIV